MLTASKLELMASWLQTLQSSVPAGKRLPLYGVVGATFLLGGYVFFFNTAKHPESNLSTSRKNQQLPGESHNKQAEGADHRLEVQSAQNFSSKRSTASLSKE